MQAINRLSGAQREALVRQDAPYLATGLMLGNPHSFEAHLRRAAGLLRDRQTSASLCARQVRHVTELFERSVPEPVRAQLACANGCSFCCHQPVKVSAAAAQLSGRRADAPRVAWLRCSLLDPAGSCSVHAVRPLACHAYVSLAVDDCRNSYPQPGNGSVREPALYNDLRSTCRMILQASLRLNDLPDTHYELNAALNLVLDTRNAEKRWLRCENIFAPLPSVSPNTPEVERVLTLMAAQIGPTL